MPRSTRATRLVQEEESDEDSGLMNWCSACYEYHEGEFGPQCPIFKEKQAAKKKKKPPPKKNSPKKGQKEDGEESGLGSAKVVSLLENIALGMDQLLKQGLSSGAPGDPNDPDDPSDPKKDPKRRRSKSVPPNRRKAPYEESDEEEEGDGTVPKPAEFAKMGLPAALAKLIPGLASASSAKTSAKSGESRTAADNVVVQVKWPHEYIYSMGGTQLSFSNMSAVQFVRGYIAMMNDSPPEIRPFMLTHLSETMVDAEKFTWDSVKSFQKDLLHGMEAGKITFRDLDTINLWRLRHAFEPIRAPKATSEAKPFNRPTLASEPCAAYNKGECPKNMKQHDGVWHMCSYCKNVRDKPIPGHGMYNCQAKRIAEEKKNGAPVGSKKPTV